MEPSTQSRRCWQDGAPVTGQAEEDGRRAHIDGQREKANQVGTLLGAIDPGEQHEGEGDESPAQVPNPGLRTPVDPGVVGRQEHDADGDAKNGLGELAKICPSLLRFPPDSQAVGHARGQVEGGLG